MFPPLMACLKPDQKEPRATTRLLTEPPPAAPLLMHYTAGRLVRQRTTVYI